MAQKTMTLRSDVKDENPEIYPDLEAEVDALQEENETLRREHETLREELAALRATNAPRPAKLPLPPRYGGRQDTARPFVASCRLYIRAQEARFPSEGYKVTFLIGLLEGAAFTWAQPFIEQEDPLTENFEDFCAALLRQFGDYDPQASAEAALMTLTQGRDSVAAYTTKFRSHAAASGWNDLGLRGHYRRGLNKDVRQFLLGVFPRPTTLAALMDICLDYGQQLAELAADFPENPRRAPATTAPAPAPTPLGRRPTAPQGRRGPLTAEEKDRRRNNNLCLYCGVAGHLVGECPARNRGRTLRSVDVPSGPGADGLPLAENPEALDGPENKAPTNYPRSKRCFLLPITIRDWRRTGATTALIDSGAEGNFMDIAYAQSLGLTIRRRKWAVPAYGIDGEPLKGGPIQFEVEISISSSPSHTERIRLDLIHSPKNPVILGHPWLQLHNPQINWRTDTVAYPSPFCRLHCASSDPSLDPLPKAPSPPSVGGINTIAPQDTSLDPSPEELPAPYRSFHRTFSKQGADTLAPHRPCDHTIDLEKGTVPPFGPLYPMSGPELAALREYIDENLAKGFIRPSKSPAASPVIFVKKKDASLRLCVDYRKLNDITIKNRYPIPLTAEIIERVSGSKIFTKLDLRGAYNLVRVRPGDEWKTAFRTRYGLFEYTVMPFGLCNAPATFQHFMNDVFRDMLDVSVIVYLDDILIFSASEADHVRHVTEVLSRMEAHHLYAKLDKCHFHQTVVEFVGFIISGDGVKMDDRKVNTILEWQQPRSLKEVQSFLGFANFYRRFIRDYSAIARPLTALTKKGILFAWTNEAATAFAHLKAAFTTGPVLIHPDPTKPFIVETDASGFAVGCVLSQTHTDGKLHPCAFYSRTLSPAERNYDIHDKELLAVKTAFAQWRHLLAGAQHTITVYTDHKNLEYFRSTTKVLTGRLARWSRFLAAFDFVLTYRPGPQGGKPDALSRRIEYKLDAASPGSPPEPVLKPSNFLVGAISSWSTDFAARLHLATSIDPLVAAVRQFLRDPAATDVTAWLSPQDAGRMRDAGAVLHHAKAVYVPPPLRLEILQARHDAPTAGHFGIARTFELVARDFWWPGLRQQVREFVASCETCKRAKAPRHQQFGPLQPLPTPARPWASLSLDFITDLPASEGHTVILVVVDRLTKMGHFIPLPALPTAEATATALVRQVFRLHGLPNDVVSDRGSQFTSKFWTRFLQLLGAQVKLSTAFHPETDGQTERLNQTLEQYLRCFVTYQQDDWVNFLPLAEFSYNNSQHASTGFTPFYANYGRHPLFDPNTPVETLVPQAEDHVKAIKDTLGLLKSSLEQAKATYKRFADRARQEPPHFNVGDRVWLSSKNVATSRPCKKLDAKRLGPFTILAKLSPLVYRLQLPPTLSIHPVFHVSLLDPYTPNPFPGRTQPPPPPFIAEDGGEEFVVKAILDSRRVRGQLQYLVDWEGYGPEDRSWEPEALVAPTAPLLTQSFHTRYPHKPSPCR